MANIRLDLDYPLEDGQSLTFKAPCDCTAITGIIVYYPIITEGASTATSKTLTLKDAHGNTLTGLGNLFSTGAYVKVVVDTVNNFAYIQNADTNKYLEDKFSNLTPTAHTHTANEITAGTFAGRVVANASAVTALDTSQMRNIKASTTDLTAGSSPLACGEIYLVYE